MPRVEVIQSIGADRLSGGRASPDGARKLSLDIELPPGGLPAGRTMTVVVNVHPTRHGGYDVAVDARSGASLEGGAAAQKSGSE